MNTIKPIAKKFEGETGHTVTLVFGSSGKMFSQIRHGAPFDVFLSADQEKPERLIASGHAVKGSQFTYAQGKLVLWVSKADQYGIMGNTPEELTSPIFQSIIETEDYQFLAMANPKLAPYGVAALEVIENLSKQTMNTEKIVQGENISQTFQFIFSGNADLGFVALSQIIDNNKVQLGSTWIVPETLYSPIKQDAVLVKGKKPNKIAQQFLEYLANDSSKKMIKNAGYSLIH